MICIERERKEKKSRSMRETFHWNSEISLSSDVLTRGGHTNRKEKKARERERNKTHKKSSSSLSLFSPFLPSVFFCLLLSCSGRQREGENKCKDKGSYLEQASSARATWLPFLSEDKQLYTRVYNWNE